MADFSQSLSEPSLSTQIFQEPVDTSTAEAIESAGSLLLETDKRVATDTLAGNLNAETQLEVDRMQTYVDKMNAGISQADPRTASQYRTRTEAALKEAINRRPGIANELRSTAITALGFDPTGGELDDLTAQYNALKDDADTARDLDVWRYKKTLDALASEATDVGLSGHDVYAAAGNPVVMADLKSRIAALAERKRGVETLQQSVEAQKAMLALDKPQAQHQIAIHAGQYAETALEQLLGEYGNDLSALVKDPNSPAKIEAAIARYRQDTLEKVTSMGMDSTSATAHIEAGVALLSTLKKYADGSISTTQMENQLKYIRSASALDFLQSNISPEHIGAAQVAADLGLTKAPSFIVLQNEMQKVFKPEARRAVAGPYHDDGSMSQGEANDMMAVINRERSAVKRKLPDLSDPTAASQTLKVTRLATIESNDATQPYSSQQWTVYADLMERTVSKPFANPEYTKVPALEKERLVQLASIDLNKLIQADPTGAANIIRDVHAGVQLYTREIVETHRSSVTSNKNGAHLIAFAPDINSGVIFVPLNNSAEADKAAKHWNESIGARAYGAVLNKYVPNAEDQMGSAESHAYREAVQLYDVPADLVKAVMHVESRSDPDKGKWVNNASSGKAGGIMQISYANAKAWGIDAHDPVQNIHTGVKYLRTLLDKYDNNPILAAAAYHAGEGNLDGYLAGKNPPGFGTKSVQYPELIAEQLGTPIDFKEYVKTLS